MNLSQAILALIASGEITKIEDWVPKLLGAVNLDGYFHLLAQSNPGCGEGGNAVEHLQLWLNRLPTTAVIQLGPEHLERESRWLEPLVASAAAA
jgi:hypothetical protein